MLPIDREDFARKCLSVGFDVGASAHYLVAAAMLRSEIQEGDFDNRFGPYQYTQDRWDRELQLVRKADPAFKLRPKDIGVWAHQCRLFATITSIFTSELADRLKRWPEPAEQYLSELVGVDICARGAESPDDQLERFFGENGAADKLAELRAIGPPANIAPTWRALVDVTSALLQRAYDLTSNFIEKIYEKDLFAMGVSHTAPRGRSPNSVEFVFATDRRRTFTTEPDIFGHERANSLTFGTMSVNVPPDPHHKIGHLELPSEFRLFGITFYREDLRLDRHFLVKEAQVFDQNEFAKVVRSDPSHTAIVFVHGFNTTFNQGALRFAQIVWDMQFKGTAVLYSWPSRGGLLNYLYDRDSALKSRPRFVELLHILQEQAEIQTLHILAHSMGNDRLGCTKPIGAAILKKSSWGTHPRSARCIG
jgi:hypothetical protein